MGSKINQRVLRESEQCQTRLRLKAESRLCCHSKHLDQIGLDL